MALVPRQRNEPGCALVLLAAAAISLPAIHARAEPEPGPSFDFRGYRAGVEIDPAEYENCPLRNETKGCATLRGEVAGVPANYWISFYHGKLSSVTATIHSAYYPDVLSAVTAKYGAPCKSEIEVWKNLAGASLENPAAVWCFASGKLTIKRMGDKANEMLFVYQDENGPKSRAVVDF